MPKLRKAANRDRKRRKKKFGMRRDGDSVFLLQKQIIKRRDMILKRKRERKEKLRD